MVGILYNVIEGYLPPSRTTLSGRLIDDEHFQVKEAIYDDLERSNHLTLVISMLHLLPLTNNASNYQLSECGKVNRYFDTSHSNSPLLRQGFVNMKIKENGLQTWVKPYW
ncbi:hypothetical protein RclHR1_00930023 [Rhizophagus clarus]|uniref:Uncharacterized protein n=1 Tax=Rhizophagus clarus TaxID=94130 RepID=A0A2Z6SED1_9GLOM|nr:hypothetical protein RclHR1_00930023 [Rhizophagus clarus]GES90018.1 hypothetical protein GLOIN_2v1695336 [Rhizophagus clarus]